LFVAKGLIAYNYISVAKGYKLSKSEKQAAREPFDSDDLKAIFEGEESIRLLSARKYMPSRPWGLLIALYTGARASEIFSLTLDDLKLDGDTLYFDIVEREGHSRVKNDASVRGVPVHPKLIELGFRKYVKKAEQVQSHLPLPMLFPDIKQSPQHGWSRNTTRWINEQYLPPIGVKKDKKKVFHSFRHSLSDRFRREASANQLKVSAYIGHNDDYGKLPTWKTGYGSPFRPSELVEIADSIDYGLDFTKLKKECLDKIRPRRTKLAVDKG